MNAFIKENGMTARQRMVVGVALLLVLGPWSRTWADVKPNSLFSDHAVLQQKMEIPVWGTA